MPDHPRAKARLHVPHFFVRLAPNVTNVFCGVGQDAVVSDGVPPLLGIAKLNSVDLQVLRAQTSPSLIEITRLQLRRVETGPQVLELALERFTALQGARV